MIMVIWSQKGDTFKLSHFNLLSISITALFIITIVGFFGRNEVQVSQSVEDLVFKSTCAAEVSFCRAQNV